MKEAASRWKSKERKISKRQIKNARRRLKRMISETQASCRYVPPVLCLERRPKSHGIWGVLPRSLGWIELVLLPLSLNILSSGQDVPEGGRTSWLTLVCYFQSEFVPGHISHGQSILSRLDASGTMLQGFVGCKSLVLLRSESWNLGYIWVRVSYPVIKKKKSLNCRRYGKMSILLIPFFDASREKRTTNHTNLLRAVS